MEINNNTVITISIEDLSKALTYIVAYTFEKVDSINIDNASLKKMQEYMKTSLMYEDLLAKSINHFNNQIKCE